MRSRTAITALAAVTAAIAVAGCTAASSPKAGSAGVTGSSSSHADSTTSTPPPPAPPAKIEVSAAAGSAAVNPAVPVVVKAVSGTLASVRVTNAAGTAVTGKFSAGRTSWTATEDLGYGKAYSLTATAANADAKVTKASETFTTLSPSNQTMPSFNIIGGNAMTNGATYGVGIVPVVHFDEPITDKAAAEKALVVTTVPHVAGAWDWVDDQNVHFRPQSYWKSGTTVHIAANVYGVEVGNGLYGQADQGVSFTIGQKRITIGDDATHQVMTYFSDKLVHTMPTAMGEHRTETVNGTFISFYTMNGDYTVIEHDNPAIMSSASYGLPANAPGGYAPEAIYYSTKISTDGIYLHELNSTIWAQGNSDVSHGCLNLNTANASWFYNHSQIGDVVEIKNTGGPLIQQWQGGDWSVPWATWTAGSALK
jgi:lipoprotein-anchoring transpeptidase ErfK/SrfK